MALIGAATRPPHRCNAALHAMDAHITPLVPTNDTAQRAEDDAALPATPLARLKALPPRNKWLLALGTAGLLAVMATLALVNRQQPFAPLFTGSVSAKDAGAAIAQLKQMDMPFQVSAGSEAIMVPADKAGELRMKMAALGLPKGTVTGFELMDNPRFGQSQLQERTSLQRALEGELTRSVGSLAAVQSARVHLALPQQNGFYREQVKPSASVVVTLHPGRVLDRAQVAGIVHLVSSSVPDLSIRAVSVIDQDGALLSHASDADSRQDLTQQQRQHVQQTEATLQKRIAEILEPVLGRDNLRATVTAGFDFNQVESTSEAYRPNQGADSAAVRSQRTVDAAGNPLLQPTGIPGAASNQPAAAATAPLASGSAPPLQGASTGLSGNGGRRENQVNYEVDKRVELTRNAVGTLKRVNVAVLVNHRVGTDAKGKPTSTALPPEEIDKLTALVQEAVGYNRERGDSVKVVNIPFRIDPKVQPEEVPVWKQPWLHELLRTGGVPGALLLVALLLVFTVIRPALARDKPAEPVAGTLDAVVDDLQALPGSDTDQVPLLEAPASVKQLADAREMAMSNPLAMANILKGWVNGEPA